MTGVGSSRLAIAGVRPRREELSDGMHISDKCVPFCVEAGPAQGTRG